MSGRGRLTKRSPCLFGSGN